MHITIWEGVNCKFNIFIKIIQTFVYIINVLILNQRQCIIDLPQITNDLSTNSLTIVFSSLVIMMLANTVPNGEPMETPSICF